MASASGALDGSRDRSPAPRQIVPNKNIRSVIRQNIGVARQKLSQ
jgi:hypothetical protein